MNAKIIRGGKMLLSIIAITMTMTITIIVVIINFIYNASLVQFQS